MFCPSRIARMLVVIGILAPSASYAVSGYAVSTMNGTGSLQYYGITEGEIWRHDIEDDVVTGHTKLVDGNASRPAINPSGTKVAFVRGDGKICLVGIDGGAVTELADGVANSMIDFPHDNWVYFTMGSYHDHDSRILKRVATDGSGVEAVEEFGWRIAQIQIANDLSRAVMRVGDSDGSETGTIIAYDMTDGSYHDVGGGSTWSCGSGFFADGQHLMDGHQDPHEEMDIRSWDGSLVKTYHNRDAVSWPPNAGAAEPSSWNHSIFHTGASTNSADWLCEAMGGSRNYASDEQVLINWRDERCIVTTADLAGPTDHGDFWVGSVAATKVARPGISPDGGSFEGSVSVSIECATSGATIRYTTNGNDPTASSDEYTGALSLDLTQSSPMTVKARAYKSGLEESDVASATFTLKEGAVLSAVEVSPSTATVATGGTLLFTAKAVDQYGDDLSPQPAIEWSISHGKDIDASGLFTAGDAEGGPYTVTAAATTGGISESGTATVTVQDAWTEDFGDGDAEGWTVGEGAWTIENGAYTNTGTASRGSYSSWAGSPDWTDLTYTVSVTPRSVSHDVWVIFRVQDERNFYLYQLSGADLYKQEEGTFSKISDGDGVSYETGTGYTIEVVLEGDRIRVYSDGTPVIDHTDNTFTDGYIGAGGYSSTIAVDDISVSQGDANSVISKRPVSNPASGAGFAVLRTASQVQVRFSGGGHGACGAELFDLDGRRVGRATGQAPLLRIDSGALAEGMYILIVRRNGSVESLPISIVR